MTTGSAFAQAQVRVTADNAIIWRADASVPAASARLDTVLDATARSDAWFEVVIPENLGGRGERGMIAASQVIAVSGVASLPCHTLKANPCSRPTAGAPASAAPASGARQSNAGAAQPSNPPGATRPIQRNVGAGPVRPVRWRRHAFSDSAGIRNARR